MKFGIAHFFELKYIFFRIASLAALTIKYTFWLYQTVLVHYDTNHINMRYYSLLYVNESTPIINY